MKLWKISQHQTASYDTFDSAVVAAADEFHAQLTHPAGIAWNAAKQEWPHGYYDWCRNPAQVDVEYIGEAAPGIEPGVIIASYNAG